MFRQNVVSVWCWRGCRRVYMWGGGGCCAVSRFDTTWCRCGGGVVVDTSTYRVEVVVVADTPAVSCFDGVGVMVAWLSTHLHVGYNRRLTFRHDMYRWFRFEPWFGTELWHHYPQEETEREESSEGESGLDLQTLHLTLLRCSLLSLFPPVGTLVSLMCDQPSLSLCSPVWGLMLAIAPCSLMWTLAPVGIHLVSAIHSWTCHKTRNIIYVTYVMPCLCDPFLDMS